MPEISSGCLYQRVLHRRVDSRHSVDHLAHVAEAAESRVERPCHPHGALVAGDLLRLGSGAADRIEVAAGARAECEAGKADTD
jgi:hypothetical protein